MTGGGANLLLVEDDAETRRSIAAFLRARGHNVRETGTAGDAIRQFEATRPDLILLDLGLPDLDGVGVVRRVRKEATTPILIVSARDREQDKIAALDAGPDRGGPAPRRWPDRRRERDRDHRCTAPRSHHQERLRGRASRPPHAA
jgi:CheY-like chemotaxis protein